MKTEFSGGRGQRPGCGGGTLNSGRVGSTVFRESTVELSVAGICIVGVIAASSIFSFFHVATSI